MGASDLEAEMTTTCSSTRKVWRRQQPRATDWSLNWTNPKAPPGQNGAEAKRHEQKHDLGKPEGQVQESYERFGHLENHKCPAYKGTVVVLRFGPTIFKVVEWAAGRGWEALRNKLPKDQEKN